MKWPWVRRDLWEDAIDLAAEYKIAADKYRERSAKLYSQVMSARRVDSPSKIIAYLDQAIEDWEAGKMTDEDRQAAERLAHTYTINMLQTYRQHASYDDLGVERLCIIEGYAAACDAKQWMIDSWLKAEEEWNEDRDRATKLLKDVIRAWRMTEDRSTKMLLGKAIRRFNDRPMTDDELWAWAIK